MALHFSVDEFEDRQLRARNRMAEQNLDGLLMFAQESMFYLTGFDSFGFCFFQCLYLGSDGQLALLTRAPDLRQAQHTSLVEDIRIWRDRAGHNPADQLKDMLDEFGCAGLRLGIELETAGLNAANYRRVSAALDGWCELIDASTLIPGLRAIKSPAEIAYVRRAAELADDALEAGNRLAVPGADEGDILAEMQGVVFRGGGDYPGNEFIIGSGRDALLCRYFTGRRALSARDQITLEFAGVYRHYHACLMRTVLTGEAHPEHIRMHAACRDALEACEAALKPGRPVGEVFDAHASVMDEAGFAKARLNACGYGLGTTFAPSWMDWPMFYTGNPVVAVPNMVFFLHMILMDSDGGRAMTLGHTVLVTKDGAERLSRASLDLVVNP